MSQKTKVNLYFTKRPTLKKDNEGKQTYLYDAEFEVVSYAPLSKQDTLLLERVVKNFRRAIQEQVFT